MRVVIADANGLIAPFKLKFNIDTELSCILGAYRIVVPEPVVGELEKLAETNVHARGALKLARSREIMPAKSRGDDSVIELASKLDGIILTNDRELIARARKRKLKVIRVKENGRLAPEEDWMNL